VAEKHLLGPGNQGLNLVEKKALKTSKLFMMTDAQWSNFKLKKV
jgi:hypothetical protein